MSTITIITDFGTAASSFNRLSQKFNDATVFPVIVANVVAAKMKSRVFSDKQSVGSNGAPIKNGEGYSEISITERKKLGRQTAYIDLQFTGRLSASFGGFPTSEGAGIGFQTENDPQAIKKASDLENRFGAIFDMTDEERSSIPGLVNELADHLIEEFK